MSNKVDVVVTTSPNYHDIFKFFQESITTHDVRVHVMDLDLMQYAQTSFRSEGWYEATRQKIQSFLLFLSNRLDLDYVIMSDADIQFFQPNRLHELVTLARIRGLDYYGMREGYAETFNTGFFVIANTERCRAMLAEVVKRLAKERPEFADQSLINELLLNGNKYNLNYDFIPAELYLWGNGCPNANAIFHHAIDTGDKVNQLSVVKDMYNKQCWQQPETFSGVGCIIAYGGYTALIAMCFVLIVIVVFINKPTSSHRGRSHLSRKIR